jgi:predicted RNA-binding protein
MAVMIYRNHMMTFSFLPEKNHENIGILQDPYDTIQERHMCEFTVYVKNADSVEQEKITRNIVGAIKKDTSVTLVDVMGNSQVVENVYIESVSTMKQELILRKIS